MTPKIKALEMFVKTGYSQKVYARTGIYFVFLPTVRLS